MPSSPCERVADQFLRQKLYIFSQFLFDDHIKSRLLKDVRFYKREATNNRFPFERASAFMKVRAVPSLTLARLAASSVTCSCQLGCQDSES